MGIRISWSLLIASTFVWGATNAQVIDTVLFNEVGRYQHPYVVFPDSFSAPTLSSRIDRLGRPYLYMACKDSGVVTLDITDPSSPVVVARHLPADFNGLNVMSLEQAGELLYVCLGNFQSGDQAAGLAIMDVSDPAEPFVLDVWDGGTTYTEGSAVVLIHEGLAYLGAMEDGIIVLDVGDPSLITFVSSYQPDPTWPGISTYAPNARGMAISGEVLYLCYDAGGLRAIDISIPIALSEIGRYLNPDIPILTNPAYNNVVVIGDRAYCTIDYCGIEVVDIGDPANMTQVAWLNPWNCIGLTWFGSDGHANEVITSHNDSLLFVSGADTEILVYDISEGDMPVLKGGYMQPNDSASTWGLDVFGDLVVGNFINNHGLAFQPYDSKYGGVVLYDWQIEFATSMTEQISERVLPFLKSNPSSGMITVILPWVVPDDTWVGVTDVHGRLVRAASLEPSAARQQEIVIDLSDRAEGLYQITLISGADRYTLRATVVN